MDDADNINDRTEVLGSQHIANDGPFKIEMSILFKAIAGEHEGCDAWAAVDLPPGQVPTDELIVEAIEAAQKSLGPNFQLASRKEFVTDILIERTGVNMNFSVPGPADFALFPSDAG